MRDVEADLTRLGQWRRQLGASLMPPIPHPALYRVAQLLVADAYDKGAYGEGERSMAWLETKARDLADVLEGAWDDWQLEAVKHG